MTGLWFIRTPAIAKKYSTNVEGGLNKKRFDAHISFQDENIAKVKQLMPYGLNTLILCCSLYIQFNDIWGISRYNLTPFYAWKEKLLYCLPAPFLKTCLPNLNLIFIGFNLFATGYNIKEATYFLKPDFLTRAHKPLTVLLNGYSSLCFAALLTRYEHLSEPVYRTLTLHRCTEYLQNASRTFQIRKNLQLLARY